MGDFDRSRYNPMTQLGRVVDRSVAQAQQRIRAAGRTAATHVAGRAITRGELDMVRWMFGPMPGAQRARVFPYNFWWPYPNDRAMAPNGNIWFPHTDYRDDFTAPGVGVETRALFMHEATHLYQYYVLGMPLMLRGLVDREYDYILELGKPFRAYGVEQMGQIVQEFCLVRAGRTLQKRPYTAVDYADILPIRRK